MEDYIKMNACPICKKQPKFYAEHFVGIGWQVTVRCKPLFRRRHFVAWAQHPNRARCLQIAVENWNREIDL